MRLDREQWLKQRLRNLLHTLVLLGGMAGLFALLGWVLAGAEGLWIFLALGLVLFALSPRVSPRLILRLYGAHRLRPAEAPGLYQMVSSLASRARLKRLPALYYIPSAVVNAFSVGSGEEAAIAVTAGLLGSLTRRELWNVLAHEVAHIQHGDLWVMSLADFISRMAFSLAWAGQLMLLFNLPFLAAGDAPLPWAFVGLAVITPPLMSLLQLGLSRSREFDADLGAVELTGDPEGLASALEKLELLTTPWWQRILLPGWRVPEPSLLRTHPPASQRIARLLQLRRALPSRDFLEEWPEVLSRWSAPGVRPRWRPSGLWY